MTTAGQPERAATTNPQTAPEATYTADNPLVLNPNSGQPRDQWLCTARDRDLSTNHLLACKRPFAHGGPHELVFAVCGPDDAPRTPTVAEWGGAS